MLDQIHVRTIFPVKGHFLNTTLWPTNAIIHPGQHWLGSLRLASACLAACTYACTMPSWLYRSSTSVSLTPTLQACPTVSGTTGTASP